MDSKKYILLFAGFSFILLIFFVQPLSYAQEVVVDAGDLVPISPADGADCEYRGEAFENITGTIRIEADGAPGSSSLVDCDDGTSLTIRIRSGDSDNGEKNNDNDENNSDNGENNDGNDENNNDNEVIECVGINATRSTPNCNFSPLELAIYNCSVVEGVYQRPIASVQDSSPVGSILIGGSVPVIGTITTTDNTYQDWYVTEDNFYVYVDIVSTTECAIPEPIILPAECDELQAIADELNQLLLSESGFEGELLCEFVRSINSRRNVPSLITQEAQQNLTQPECINNDPDYDAALVSFIDLLETLREYDIETHQAILRQVEIAGVGACDFLTKLMQEQQFVTVQTDTNPELLTSQMVSVVVLSCEPFMEVNLLDEIVDSMTNFLSIGLEDLLIEAPLSNSLCSIVTNLAILGGTPWNNEDNMIEQRLFNAIQTTCGSSGVDLAVAVVLDTMVQINSTTLDETKLLNALSSDVSESLCAVFVGNLDDSLLQYVIEFAELDNEVLVAIELITTTLIQSECIDDDTDTLIHLTFSLYNQWQNLNGDQRQTLLANSDPCKAISGFLVTGQISNEPTIEQQILYTERVQNSETGSNRNETVIFIEDNQDTAIMSEPIFQDGVPEGLAVGLATRGNSASLWLLNDGKWEQIAENSGLRQVWIDPNGRLIVYLLQTESGVEIRYGTLEIQGGQLVLSQQDCCVIRQSDLQDEDIQLSTDQISLLPSVNGSIYSILFGGIEHDSETELGELRVYQATVNFGDGAGIINNQTVTTLELPSGYISTSHAGYSNDGRFILVQTTNGEQRSGTELYSNSGEIIAPIFFSYDDNRLCESPVSPIFDGTVASFLALCLDENGLNRIVNSNFSRGISTIEVDNFNPIDIFEGPAQGQFTLLTDDGQSIFVTTSENSGENDTEADVRSFVPLTLDEGWRIEQLIWAASSQSARERNNAQD